MALSNVYNVVTTASDDIRTIYNDWITNTDKYDPLK